MKIGIIDISLGNLYSVCQAFKKLGHDLKFVSSPEELPDLDAIILPGVGAFPVAMASLKSHKLDQAITTHIKANKPFLGICLGMQLMFEGSDEFGSEKGLGILKGWVKKFQSIPMHPIPHVGWNSLYVQHSGDIWKGLPLNMDAYFVHSYRAEVQNSHDVVAYSDYADEKFPAIVQSGNAWGVQFHPEKSGVTGLKFLENWIKCVSK